MPDEKTVTDPFSQAVKNAQATIPDNPPASQEGDPPPATENSTEDQKGAGEENQKGNQKGSTEEESPPEGLSDAAKENWKKTRDQIKELQTQKNSLEATLADREASLNLTTAEFEKYKTDYKADDIQQLRIEREDLEYRLAMVDLDSSPKVKEKVESFRELKKSVLKNLSSVLQDMPDLEDLVSLDPATRDKKIAAYAKEKEIDSVNLARVWVQTDKLDTARTEVNSLKDSVKVDLDTWKQQKELSAREEKDQQRLRSHQLYQQGLEAAMDPEKGLPQFFRKQEGEEHELFNKLVDETIGFSKKVATEPLNEQELIEVAFFAGVGRTAVAREQVMTKALADLKAERDALKERVKGLERNAPGGGSFQGGGSGGGSEQGGNSSTPFMDSVRSGIQEAQS